MNVWTVVFDNGGTLPTSNPRLMNGAAVDTREMAFAIALAQGSGHTTSKAIVDFGKYAGIAPATIENIVEGACMGIRADFDVQELRLARAVGAMSRATT